MLAVALAAGAAGCGGDDENTSGTTSGAPAETTAAGTAPSRLALTLSGTRKKATMTGPATVSGGLVEITFTSEVKGASGAQLIRFDGERSPEEIEAAGVAWGENGKALPDWMFLEGGVDSQGPEPATSVQVLEPGRYAAVDTDSNQKPSPAHAFEVTAGEGGELPPTDARIEMKEYAFAAEGLKAGGQKVLVENTGSQPHFIVGAPLAQGATVEDAKTFLESEGKGAEGPPPIDFERSFSTSIMDGGGAQVVDLDLAKGRYVLVCFVPDRAGGAPHVAKGMVSEVTVG